MAADQAGPVRVAATREQLADLAMGSAPLPGNAEALTDFGQVFDRSQFLSRDSLAATHAATVKGNP